MSVTGYVVGAVLFRFTSDSAHSSWWQTGSASDNPWWLLMAALLGGAASVWANRKFEESGATPSLAWHLHFLATLLTGMQLFVLFVASVFIVSGSFSFATSEIVIGGRGKAERLTGRAARFAAMRNILAGAFLAAWAVMWR